MSIDWTTVVTSGFVAGIISGFQFLTTRYLGKMLDRIEKNVQPKKVKRVVRKVVGKKV